MRNKSFTLIELLVVIVIIGILAGVIIVSTSSSIGKANFAKAQAFSNTVQQELLLNLVSEWTFDEDSGTVAKDTWGNNDGTVIGGAIHQDKALGNCVYGGCYFFDGTDGYIDLSEKSNLLGFSRGTFITWFKTNSFNAQAIFGEGDITTDYGSLTIGDRTGSLTDESMEFVLKSGGSNRLVFFARHGQKYYSDNKWHQFVVTVGDDCNSFYADGEKQILTYSNGTQATGKYFLNPLNLDSMSIGRRFYPNSPLYFNGLIDDVRIYNAALTTAQIKQEYVAGLNSLLANGSISKEEYDQRLNNLASK